MPTYKLNRSQYHLLQEMAFMGSPDKLMSEMPLDEGFNVISHRTVVEEIRKIINSGVFCSLIGIKKDGSLRAYNIHKTPSTAMSQISGAGNYDPSDHNLIRFWDRNAHRKVKDPETGAYKDVIGGWAQAFGDGLIYFKKSPVVYDFTEINADKISRVDPNLLAAMVKQLGIFNNNPQMIKVQ